MGVDKARSWSPLDSAPCTLQVPLLERGQPKLSFTVTFNHLSVLLETDAAHTCDSPH